MERRPESFWQDRWHRAGLARAHRRLGAEKFYAIVAYPGTSGFLHVGHLRGMTLADALHRYHRMLGKAVFFPTGTHASGLPAVTFAQKVQERDPTTTQQLQDQGVPEHDWAALEDPSYAARFLGQTYLEVYRRLGVLVDDTAYVTTIDEDYQAFIRWQFHRLHAAGALVQAPHFSAVCPVCGPVSVDASETDLSQGGDAEWITYTTVPFRLDDGRVLLAATLRPETVYGVTNLWVASEHPLVIWHHGEHPYLVGQLMAHRLVEQHGGRVGHTVDPGELLGQRVAVPQSTRKVPVLPSRLVEPDRGTGVVMAVPAHAPADWLGLQEVPEETRKSLGEVPEIIRLDESMPLSPSERGLVDGPGPPAARAARAVGAHSIDDRVALERATERLYRLEFVRGRMRPDILGGIPVVEAREEVARRLRLEHSAPDLQEFSKPVICRRGHDVLIRRVPDQWFLRYGDPAWKTDTRALVARMTVHPREYQQELPGILDWFQDRPATRRGRWLGTPFPLDPTWVIEPIADSTFYPAYFPVRRFVADGRVPVSALTDEFFDFVYLDRGEGEPTLDPAVQRTVRDEFRYWYPLDLNIGGKEHKRVHFPVFLYTHARLLPPELQPRGLAVHWWITDRGGEKISKKEVSGKKRVPPVGDAVERWGADALRLYYAQAASPDQDIEWDAEAVSAIAERLRDLERLARQLGIPGTGGPPELDRWLEAEFHDLTAGIRKSLDDFEFRQTAELVYARAPALFRRYLHRGGSSGAVVQRLLGAWVRFLSPITPHLAEDLGEGRAPNLVATERFPSTDDFVRSGQAVDAERFLDRIEEDLQNVLRPTEARGEAPEGVLFFVAAPWKRTVEEWLRTSDSSRGGTVDLRVIMTRAREHPEMAAFLGEIPKYVQRVAPQVRSEGGVAPPELDEVGLLKSAEGYLARRFRFEEVAVFPELEAEEHDPAGRRDRARPGRPAFFLVIPAASRRPERSAARGPAST